MKKKVGEIELESTNKKIDNKNILWKATKIIERKTNQKWIFSLSNKNGVKSISEYEDGKTKKQIESLKKK